jgi:hypothetical protein
MTLEELCFIVAAVIFALDALPRPFTPFPLKLQPTGLALVAFGLALGVGLAARLGVQGKIL